MTKGHRIACWMVVAVAACGGGGGGPDGEAVCDDTVDNDEDGQSDCADRDCADSDECIAVPEQCTGGLDEDNDLAIDCADDDCWQDPVCFDVDDPVDLTTADGDPTLDLDKVGVTLAGGTAEFFVTMEGAWPPPSTLYSWFLLVEIDNDGNTPVASVTIEHHAGLDDVIELGVTPANVTIRSSPRGVFVRLVGVAPAGEKYYVESGVQRTDPGTRVTDTAVSAPAPIP
jgi:hypothetical protein